MLCDFGFSRLLHEATRAFSTIQRGRQRFLAPELLAIADTDTKFRTSEATDVFSEALVLLSAWTGKLPFPDMGQDLASNALRKKQRPVRPNHRNEMFPLDTKPMRRLWDLVEEMWRHDPSQRPRAHDVERRTEALLQQFILE